jgi:hypothetical protein
MLLDSVYQSIDVGAEVRIGAHGDGVAKSKGLQRRRQVFLSRHRGALHEYWNHRDIALQGSFNLDSQVIAGIIQAALPSVVSCF